MLYILIPVILIALILVLSYFCFYLTFYVTKKSKISKEEYEIAPGKVYEPHRDTMVNWMKELRAMPCEEFTITSFDGLQLYGHYYEFAPGAPMEIIFHGYRGNSERDLCGGVQRCFCLGRNALLISQRTSGKSEGRVITFGIKEHRDCLQWVDFAVEHFGKDVAIYLTGISMGATTVLMAAGKPLPPNVIGVVADCGFTSARAIIHKVIRQIKLPVFPIYPLIRLGALLYGGFRLESYSALEAVKNIQIPVVFIHGEDDAFVPCSMGIENYEACASDRKHLFTVPNTGHGLAYIIDPEGYKKALKTFD